MRAAHTWRETTRKESLTDMRGRHGRLDPDAAGPARPLPVRVTNQLYTALQRAATEESRSLSDFVRVTLQDAMDLRQRRQRVHERAAERVR